MNTILSRLSAHVLEKAPSTKYFFYTLVYLRGDLSTLPESAHNIPILEHIVDELKQIRGSAPPPVIDAIHTLLLGTVTKYLYLLYPESKSDFLLAARKELEACVAWESSLGTEDTWIMAHAQFELAELEALAGNWNECADRLQRLMGSERSPTSIIVTEASSPSANISSARPGFISRSGEEGTGNAVPISSPSASRIWKAGSPSSVGSSALMDRVRDNGFRYPFRNALRRRCQLALIQVEKRRGMLLQVD